MAAGFVNPPLARFAFNWLADAEISVTPGREAARGLGFFVTDAVEYDRYCRIAQLPADAMARAASSRSRFDFVPRAARRASDLPSQVRTAHHRHRWLRGSRPCLLRRQFRSLRSPVRSVQLAERGRKRRRSAQMPPTKRRPR
jgi:hypothetical protein